MASSSADPDEEPGQTIRLVEAEDGWIATDEETGVTSQGDTRAAALENLDTAVALFRDDDGRAPTDEELQDIGIDPADNVTGEREPPDVLE
jgi:predicted RNase H-like HicB family nuclease